MHLQAIDEQETAVSAQAHWVGDGTDTERSEPAEAALDGVYLLPVTLFETNKSLFDPGMHNLFSTLAAGVRRNAG